MKYVRAQAGLLLAVQNTTIPRSLCMLQLQAKLTPLS